MECLHQFEKFYPKARPHASEHNKLQQVAESPASAQRTIVSHDAARVRVEVSEQRCCQAVGTQQAQPRKPFHPLLHQSHNNNNNKSHVSSATLY